MPARLWSPGGSSVYEALTDWVDLSPAIKAAWDAGPDADPGSYHPDNAGDWTLTHTPGTPGTLTLAGTTGATTRDGWDEWARFNVGALATLMGVEGAVLADTDTIVMMESSLAALGTRNASQPLMMAQVGPDATTPGAALGNGAGWRWMTDTRGAPIGWGTTISNVAVVTNSSAGGRASSTSAWCGESSLIVAYGQDSDGAPTRPICTPAGGHVAADARLWFGAGQQSATAAAFTGFATTFRARLLRRLVLPWDPDFGL